MSIIGYPLIFLSVHYWTPPTQNYSKCQAIFLGDSLTLRIMLCRGYPIIDTLKIQGGGELSETPCILYSEETPRKLIALFLSSNLPFKEYISTHALVFCISLPSIIVSLNRYLKAPKK